MVGEVMKKTETPVDGFSAGYSEPTRYSGDDTGRSPGSFGIKIKFTKDARWVDPDDNEVKQPLIALDVVNRVHKWADDGGPPLETITLKPGQEWPDINAINETCRDEWYEKFGQQVGPWQGEHTLLFADPASMVSYWWPSPVSTIGACVALRELMTQTKRMRAARQRSDIFPLIELSHCHMPTKYGGHERPSLKVLRWITFGSDSPISVLPKPTDATAGLQTVDPPSIKEELADEIKF